MICIFLLISDDLIVLTFYFRMDQCTPIELISSSTYHGTIPSSSNTPPSTNTITASSVKLVTSTRSGLDIFHENYDVLNMTTNNIYNNMQTENDDVSELIEDFLTNRVAVALCLFGLIGNSFNILVLTRKGLIKTMDRMERSAHAGLIALALSDFFFCLCILPHAWIHRQFAYTYYSFSLFYNTYNKVFINIFIQSSTWLTVTMAIGRYVAICHPLRARDLLGVTSSCISIGVVFLISVFVNCPRMFLSSVVSIQCLEGGSRYYKGEGFLRQYANAEYIYSCVYFAFGVVLPLIILAFCNIYLIKTLRQSFLMRRQYRRPGSPSESKHHVTLTLVIIVLMFFILVIPTETMTFFKYVIHSDVTLTSKYNFAVSLFNTLQALNFSSNFLLYCAVNAHFRSVITSLFPECLMKKTDSTSSSSSGSRPESSMYTGISNISNSISKHSQQSGM